MNKMLTALSVLLIGCGTVYPGNQTINIIPDACVREKGLQVLLDGATFWDPIGGKFGVNVDSQYNLKVYCEESLNSNPSAGAQYVPSLGVIQVKASILTDYADSPDLLRVVFAHELGHSMGLRHVTDAHSVMSPFDSYVAGLSEFDVAEYEALWGKN